VALVRTDVSEELGASYIWVKRRFLQAPHGVTTQKIPFFIVTAVKTSNLTVVTVLHKMFTSFLQQATSNGQINNNITRSHIQRMSSENADELEEGKVKVNNWEIVKNNKRRRINTSQVDIPHTEVTLSNRFDPLPMVESDSQTDPAHETPKPHPYLYMG
jgi:hypothetical protein